MERYMCVSRPLESASICSKKWAKNWLIIISFILIVFYSPTAIYKMKWQTATKTYVYGKDKF